MGIGGASNVVPVTGNEEEPSGSQTSGALSDLPPPVPPGQAPPGWTATPPPPPSLEDIAKGIGAGSLAGPPTALLSPPVDKRQAGRWFFYAVLGFLVGQIMGVIFGEVAGVLAGKTSAQMKAISAANVPPEWYVVSTLVGLWFGFFGAPWLASRTQGTRHFISDLGLRFKAIDAVGLFIGVGAQIVIALLYAPFRHDIHNFNAPSQKLTGSAHGGGFLIIAFATVFLAPAMEELFFRGLLLRSLVRLFSRRDVQPTSGRTVGVVLAVIVDGLLFGLAHGEWVQFAGLALFGVVLAAISYSTGRLGMNMVAHASFNLVAVLAILHQRGGVIH